MKKRFIFLLITLSLFFFLAGERSLFAITKGKVILTENNRLFVARGESITVNLGEKDGVLKGDTLKILKNDGLLKDVVGECIVTKTSSTLSTCEILRTGKEVEKGDIVFAETPDYFDERIGKAIVSALKEALEPYPPERKISMYFAGVYDREKRVTSFSRLVEREFVNVVFNKKQIRNLEREEEKKLKGIIDYPDAYFKIGGDSFYLKEVEELKKAMASTKLDLILMGTCEIEGEKLVLSIYYIDRNFGVKRIVSSLPKELYSQYLEEVIEPFSPLKPRVHRDVKVSYRSKHFFPTSHEQRDIAVREAEDDIEFRYTVLEKKLRFNRISAENIVIRVDQNPLKIAEGQEVTVSLGEGTHTVSVSFQPAFYRGSELVYVSKRKIRKDISLVIAEVQDKPAINLDITVEPGPGGGSVRFDVYRRAEVVKKILNTVGVRTDGVEEIQVYSD